MQATLAEKLGGVVFDGLRTRFHATRALVYLGNLDMVKMSLFDPYPSDGDSVLWSDESSSSTARYARLVPSPPPVMKYLWVWLWCGDWWVWLRVHLLLYYRQVLGLTSSMPILLLGHCFVSRMYHSHLHCCCHG